MSEELLDLPLASKYASSDPASPDLASPDGASLDHGSPDRAASSNAASSDAIDSGPSPSALSPSLDSWRDRASAGSRRADSSELGPRSGAPGLSSAAPPGTLAFVPRNPASGSNEPLADVLPFRRKDLKRRKTSLAARLVRPALTALVIVGLPVLAVIWLWHAPQFAMAQVGFAADSQHKRVPKVWVETALSEFIGRNIWELPLGEAEFALKQHPWVASVSLHKEPPRTLTVRVVERAEVALYRGKKSELFYVDDAGRLIDRFDLAKGGSDLPIFSGGDPEVLLPSAVALLRELEAVRPIWLHGLSEIEILGERDYRLFTADIPFPLLVRAGTLNDKARRLQALLPQIVDRYPRVTAVDLRFARRIIVQPTDLGDSPAVVKPPAKNT